MRIRWLSLGLVAFLVFAVAGCGQASRQPDAEDAKEGIETLPPPSFDVPESTIAYLSEQELWTISTDGGDAHKVADVDSFVSLGFPQSRGGGYFYQWAISEDESLVGVGWIDCSTGKAVIYDEPLPTPTDGESYGAFTADGSRCYLPGTDRVLRWSLPEGTMEPIGPTGLVRPRAVILSPDEKKVAARTDAGLLVMDVDGQNAHIDPTITHAPFTFSGDGATLFVGDRVGNAEWPIYTFAVAADNSLSDKQQWSGAAGSLEYISGVVQNHSVTGQLSTWLPQGSGLTKVGDFTAAMKSLDWSGYDGQYGYAPSPDGRYLAALKEIDNLPQLFILTADGETAQLIDMGELGAGFPEWLE